MCINRIVEMEQYKLNLLFRLNEFKENIKKSDNEYLIVSFEDSWFKQVEDEINDFCTDNKDRYPIPAYKALVGYPFLILHDEEKFNKLNNAIKTIDSITNRRKAIKGKIKKLKEEYKSNEDPENAFEATIFEILVISRFVENNNSTKIDEIDFKHLNDSGRNVDAKIKILNRDVLLEATLISKNLRKSTFELRDDLFLRTGKDIEIISSVGTLSIDKMIAQVVNKIKDKSKQIGDVKEAAILVIGLPSGIGVDQITSKIAVEQQFKEPDVSTVSCIIIGGSFLIQRGEVYFNPNATNPFNDAERAIIESIFESKL